MVQLFGIVIHGLKSTKESTQMKEVTPLIIISLNKGASLDMITVGASSFFFAKGLDPVY